MGQHPGPSSDPAARGAAVTEHHELRILVLHNRDFDAEQHSGDVQQDHTARADVVNAARDVARALASRGHFVEVQGTDVQDVGALVQRLQADRPDLVFNLCESLGGDARHEVVVPSLLDMLQIPYTGTGPLGLGLALRKERTKTVLEAAGIRTPHSVVLPPSMRDPAGDLLRVQRAGLAFPLILKPAREDASAGISSSSVVHDEAALRRQVALLREAYDQPLMCEQYVHGREINVSLLGNDPPEVLPLHEIDFSGMPSGKPHILCYLAKWDRSSPEYLGSMPRAGVFTAEVRVAVEQAARAAFAALELCDYGRCDIRLTDGGEPYIIDVNPNCDLSDGAGLSLAARSGGLGYEDLVQRIVVHALERQHHDSGQRRERGHLHLLDTAGAASGSTGPLGARHEGRAVYAGRGEVRPRTNRRRAL